jgi:hypothetical protein
MAKKNKTFDLYEYNTRFSKDIQVSYKGPFDKHVLAVLGQYLRDVVGKNPQVSNKLFKIFIELAQNIAFFSGDMQGNSVGSGILVIREDENYFYMHTGNPVITNDIYPIVEKCEIINSLDRDSLREYKREQRNLPRGQHGTAHIGLIQVALTSANPLEIDVTQIDEETSFFALTVKINKSKEEQADF